MSSTASVFRAFDEYYQDESSLRRNNDNDDKHDDNDDELHHYSLFTPKYQLSIMNNPLVGICFPEWVSILKRRYHQIEFRTYWPRIIFISCMSIMNSLLGILDYIIYGKQIAAVQINPRPVFILGHPRTGTTLLHSVVGLDEQQFTFCSTFCAGFPSSFLSFEAIGKQLLKGVMTKTRPMDNMPLGFDLPQEDEIATNVMSGGTSPYMPLFLMKQEREFRPYYAFTDDNDTMIGDDTINQNDEQLDSSVMANVRKKWIDSFLHLLRKLTVRDQKQRQPHAKTSGTDTPPRRLLIKSPVHTARIPLLLNLFPEAQFVYIHRHPYDVLQSAIHMADTTYWYTYMNTPSNQQILEFILRQYEILYNRYESGRQLLSKQQLIEISYDELTTSPILTIQRIYNQLGWNWTLEYEMQLVEELDDIQSYQRNQHKPLQPYLKEIVNDRWGPSFERFEYNIDRID